MPFKPGESGNISGGVPREKKFLQALERAIAQSGAEQLRKTAEKLLECAAAGHPWAVNMLADRLDGKATQQIEMRVRDERTEDMSDDDLLRVAAAGRDGTAEAQASAQKPSELH